MTNIIPTQYNPNKLRIHYSDRLNIYCMITITIIEDVEVQKNVFCELILCNK